MTRERLGAQGLARVRSRLAQHVDSGSAPGAVAVVARRGEVQVMTAGTLAFEGAGAAVPMAGDTRSPGLDDEADRRRVCDDAGGGPARSASTTRSTSCSLSSRT